MSVFERRVVVGLLSLLLALSLGSALFSASAFGKKKNSPVTRCESGEDCDEEVTVYADEGTSSGGNGATTGGCRNCGGHEGRGNQHNGGGSSSNGDPNTPTGTVTSGGPCEPKPGFGCDESNGERIQRTFDVADEYASECNEQVTDSGTNSINPLVICAEYIDCLVDQGATGHPNSQVDRAARQICDDLINGPCDGETRAAKPLETGIEVVTIRHGIRGRLLEIEAELAEYAKSTASKWGRLNTSSFQEQLEAEKADLLEALEALDALANTKLSPLIFISSGYDPADPHGLGRQCDDES